ncbi:ABC transporter ATP-binding protein [Tenacibaculum sp. IB213877]|uniref:ABC transporter ATP-binding protein n=1 Tax=Tenacibaculum sp. IB213877 TaxID=3097351 RepID=UPI002A5AC023|nr:ATP-binding cassette domain-containing protein [Tenacibaculum sp. IB213877]MDY0780036.1 ATP-binding cassette domain-containing protein [Tenacibaculum sp. IB213877]
MIEVNDIYKSFGDTEVLKGISTSFEAGKTSLIIGQSGAGKTVFLKSLLGLHTPEKGTIVYNGVVNTEMTIEDKREFRQELGMVFQGSALFDSQTVEENVMFPLKMFTKKPFDEMLDRVNFVLERVNLENSNKKFPAELSGGMQKRVAIARAIVMKPNYLFCDEPNSGLDPRTSILIDNLIQEITEEYQITTVINTHDMNSVMEIGDKIVFLKDGVKAWEGSSKEIFRTDNQAVVDFVYSSDLYKKVRQAYLNDY